MVRALRPARLAAAALLLLAGAARPADAKLAFLFVAAGPLPLAETWERFFAPAPKDQYSIHVHTHPNVTLTAENSSPIFVGTEIDVAKRIAVKWGRNVWEAEALLFQAALSDADNAYFFLLSDHCMPIRTFAFVDSYVRSDPSANLVQSWPTQHRWSEDLNVPADQWREGSNWVGVSRTAAGKLAANTGLVSSLRRLAETNDETWGMDEHWKQTILHNESVAHVSPTWTSWPPEGSSHPLSYRTEGDEAPAPGAAPLAVTVDTEAGWKLLRTMQAVWPRAGDATSAVPRLFARKVSPLAARMLYNFVEVLDGDTTYLKPTAPQRR